jgi:hypothetical protein
MWEAPLEGKPGITIMQKSLLILTLVLASLCAMAGNDIPRLPDGSPDLSGVWMGSGSSSADIRTSLKEGEEVILLPGEDLLEYIRNDNNIDLEHIDAPAQLP